MLLYCCFTAALLLLYCLQVVVQSYNAVLSLSHLLDTTDALLALHNEDAHDICMSP
jgi:hypothetical protein